MNEYEMPSAKLTGRKPEKNPNAVNRQPAAGNENASHEENSGEKKKSQGGQQKTRDQDVIEGKLSLENLPMIAQ